MSIRLDLTGKVIGKLTVLGFSHMQNSNSYWECRCDCGAVLAVRGQSLKSGRTQSCGCGSRSVTYSDFESCYMPVTESGCWIWLGTIRVDTPAGGYGGMRIDGKSLLAHRYCYELHKGPTPKGMHVLHKCDVPSCINPDHLYLGSHADNMRDRDARGRNGLAKLNNAQALNIRDSLHEQSALCVKYGISPQTILDIRSGRTWRHL